MKLYNNPPLINLLFIGAVAAQDYPSLPPWHPPGSSDVRAPCPMLNSLANHGYLPHDGKDITLEKTIEALDTALNIDAELATFLYNNAITTNPTPNATTYSLNDLSNHNILEHDASLSRADFYWSGDAHTFNQTVFDETRSYWTGPVIDVQMAADARLARVKTSMATNPDYSMSDLGSGFSIGETAAYIIIIGDSISGTVEKSWVEYLFENERLPAELGWSRHTAAATFATLNDMMDRVENATGPLASKVRRVGMHDVPRRRTVMPLP
ncbi:hypothetical protein JX265_000773 [Neoarthrinium moseri]|uniref:Heme haloperoxidase family profile domain-containing protein n=1 Tax=Neoarthrinium moseri TaxID=1658444 RepID=A0A9P9WWF2_9PEZI|nr:uncharacterized protein JN550_007120 [Neoarthrinium moseri]KAI1847523.1 hypothetical protein JX266_006375 [Neoarthrinium moseri]KAI1867389.1 hypothetical protein JN550_007120 [Neoarthrinium moseri]KAI1880533.1 hypothetical protein JX265_000773 [Neoarthrinium moseri]